jgi:hypothetical protein
MNQLVQLAIVGEVTPCTQNVWIQNQIVGARVHWIINGHDNPGPVATSTYKAFPIPPVKLGDKSAPCRELPATLTARSLT